MISRYSAKLAHRSAVPFRGFAATEKQVKQRIRSVSNIEKITKAMKMVAASKVRGDLARLAAGQNFGHQAISKMFEFDTYMQRKAPPEEAQPKLFIVPISSDRGLCGSINSNIVREVKDFIKTNGRKNCKILVVGDKGSAGLLRNFPDCMEQCTSDLGSPMNFELISSIADRVATLSEGHHKILIFYNEYVSAIRTDIKRMEMMPRKRFYETMKFQKSYEMAEPDAITSIPAIYELYLSSSLWRAALHNVASETSARMNAMENASKNAKEMIAKLDLQKNKARQARITMELCEIISGASAL